MSAIKMPAFTAEATLYRSGTHYQVGVILAEFQLGGEGLVHPALRFFCGMKTCCFQLWSDGSFFCCEDDFCFRVPPTATTDR
jgi:hypothetical protein